jgi:hypothetical protein
MCSKYLVYSGWCVQIALYFSISLSLSVIKLAVLVTSDKQGRKITKVNISLRKLLSYSAPYWVTPHHTELRRTLPSYAASYWATPHPTELRRTLASPPGPWGRSARRSGCRFWCPPVEPADAQDRRDPRRKGTWWLCKKGEQVTN